MSTWYGYVCLSHEPPLEQDRMFHGHKGEEFLIWNLKRRRGQVQETSSYHDQNGTANAWLDEHENCNVGVKDGYGETVYTYNRAVTGQPKLFVENDKGQLEPYVPEVPVPAVTKATEIEPGKQYLLSMGGSLTNEQADAMRARLKERFPTNTFVLASPNIAVVPVVQLAQGGPGAGDLIDTPPPAPSKRAQGQPHAVRQNDLLDAVKRAEAECERQWRLSRAGDREAWTGAMLGLHELVVALINPPVNVSTEATEPEAAVGSDWCGALSEGYTCRLKPGHVSRGQGFHKAYNGKTIADSSEIHAWTDEHQ